MKSVIVQRLHYVKQTSPEARVVGTRPVNVNVPVLTPGTTYVES